MMGGKDGEWNAGALEGILEDRVRTWHTTQATCGADYSPLLQQKAGWEFQRAEWAERAQLEAEKAPWEAGCMGMRNEMARGEDERHAQHAECASQLHEFVLRFRYPRRAQSWGQLRFSAIACSASVAAAVEVVGQECRKNRICIARHFGCITIKESHCKTLQLF
jgi:hypothetical protein